MCVLAAMATVCGPVVEAIQLAEATRWAAEEAQPASGASGDQSEQGQDDTGDQAVVIVEPFAWDRVVKSAAPVGLSRAVIMGRAPAGSPHHLRREEVAHEWPSASTIMTATGMLLNHAPHAPPPPAVLPANGIMV